MDEKVIKRFWKKVNKNADEGCWIWTGATRTGYGEININKEIKYAHRVSWELHFGPIPPGKCVLHRCDVRACIRPDHLFLGSKMDNTCDMIAKHRNKVGEERKNTKLTVDKVKEIRQRHISGAGLSEMAREYNVGLGTVFDVVHNKTWFWIGNR